MNENIKALSINYGLYLGGALALASILAYAINLGLFAQWWFGIILLVLLIVMGVFSIIKAKQSLQGFITFKDAFTAYFITIGIGLAISSFVSIIIFNVIDPEATVTLKDMIIETQAETMKKWGAPQESIEKVVNDLEQQENMFSIGNSLKSLVFQIAGYSILGLFLALIMKRNPEN